MKKGRPADAADRAKAIDERTRNVIVDAGAGTGKTTLLIARLLNLIAPEDDGPAFSLDRIAAITFTRKAAGELKLRLRETLLLHAGAPGLSELRNQRLRRALELLDNASISTVHSFADRLLRLRPVDAKLSPAYEIAEDATELVEETYRGLLDLSPRAASTSDAERERAGHATEASETVRMFQAAGLRVRTQELEWGAFLGLDAFVRDVIETRDRHVILPPASTPDLRDVQRCIDELVHLVKALPEDNLGSRTLQRLSDQAARVAQAADSAEALRRAVAWSRDLRKAAKELTQREHFSDDPRGWATWKWISEGTRGSGKRKEERSGGPLGAALVAPLMAFMATRLVRLRPLILQRYEQVKRAHGVVDQIDLLIKLRDLLQQDHAAREFYQARFDHLLIDEFQDTDPLQAEIAMYLGEAGARAERTDDIVLQPGKLTIVGDPKQSIYRFRRADIAMYAAVCAQLRKAPVCEAQLTVNFRSAANILAWLNEGFDSVLGAAGKGPLYDADSGEVRNVRLTAAGKPQPHAGVHVLPFGTPGLKVDESRDLEGEALAHYLRYLVEDSELQIADPRTQALRRPRYGDIAVMMIATQTVHHLTSELDRLGVPHVVRGGTLFMQDPLHQQFVLGLRALADRADGVAQAALLRPPFFAISLEDLVRARATELKSAALQETETLITALRRGRHHATPGEFARRVLEQTGFGRYVAAGVNGAQRLARLYELCSSLDELGRTSQLDFDGVTAIARGWIDAPPRIEAPLPVDADAVQVITAHQAKGLEWQIVALWDGSAGWRAYLPQVAFTVDGVSGEWAVKLDGLVHDPTEAQLQKRESELRAAERKRVAYVAATRARDVLIIPEAGEAKDKTIAGMLLNGAGDAGQTRVRAYLGKGKGVAWWEKGSPVSMRPLVAMREGLQDAWQGAVERAFVERLAPKGIASVSHVIAGDPALDTQEAEPIAHEPSEGRYGPVFGSVVHRALQLVLERGLALEPAVRAAAREIGMAEGIEIALEDVRRAHVALREAGLLEHPLRVEYPIAGASGSGSLLAGYIDLVIASPEGPVVIDFKTDAVPRGDLGVVYPMYVAQVRTYGMLLADSGVAGQQQVRTGLLFTADGGLRWV
jgi:ATP-dependent helicase/nuclease subunit A